MPWPKDHKQQTRKRIIESAAAAFRARGIAGVRVEDVMTAAGLTHGGFYAHFDSKEALLEEALGHAGGETLTRLSGALGPREGDRSLAAVADAYLSPEHVTHPQHGCPVAALGPEVAREDGRSREALAAGLKDRLEWMRSLAPAGGKRREDQVIGVLACMIGGVVLARVLGQEAAPGILRGCRSFIRGALEEGPRKLRPQAASAAAPRARKR